VEYGAYNCSLRVSDGCTDVTAFTNVIVNCLESHLQVSANASVTDVFWKDQGGLIGEFDTVLFDTTIGPVCNAVKTITWSHASHSCAVPRIKSVVTPAPTPQQCITNTRYAWDLIEKPCTSESSNVSIVNSDQMVAKFSPDTSGTYRMRLTVADTCTTSTSTVTLTARCTQKITANAGALQQILFACDRDDGFPDVFLHGEAYAVDSSTAFTETSKACKAIPATPAPSAVAAPAPLACCPQCTSCQSCSTCPGCMQTCNCNKLGWEKVCGMVTKSTTVQVPRTFFFRRDCMPQSALGEAACTKTDVTSCPTANCVFPNCQCLNGTRLVEETRTTQVNECEWTRVPIPGVVENPNNFRLAKEASPLSRRRNAQPAPAPAMASDSSATFDASETFGSDSPFAGVFVTLGVLLLSSTLVNVVYWKKIRSANARAEQRTEEIAL
jgi:hypothetical protein